MENVKLYTPLHFPFSILHFTFFPPLFFGHFSVSFPLGFRCCSPESLSPVGILYQRKSTTNSKWRKIYNAIPWELLFYYFSLNGENQRDITILLPTVEKAKIQREQRERKKK